MTETIGVKALREAAMKATEGEWCTDSQHSVIADAGLNENYYVSACSGPDSKINASFIAMENPATIIALLDQLEAERQRADVLQAEVDRVKQQSINRLQCLCKAGEARERAEAELAALRGTQEPVAYLTRHMGCRSPDDCEEYLEVSDKEGVSGNGETAIPVFTHPPKPVVVLPKLTVGEVMHRSGFDRQYAEGWVSANDWAINELKLAGIVVKDGE